MIDLYNKKILILGAGKTGISTAIFCKKKGANVFVCDEKNDKYFYKLNSKNINLLISDFNKLKIDYYDYIIQSPGIDRNNRLLKKADSKKIPVLGEIELISYFCKVPIIAVTGTNGKSTTAELIKYFLTICERRVALAGNIGIPFSAVLDESLDFIILELSSYQLETIKNFKPYIAILTNITQDHLDRHKTMEKYFDIKKKIFSNMDKDNFLIVNKDNYYLKKINNKKNYFSLFGFSTKKEICGIYCKNNYLYLNLFKKNPICLFSVSDIRIIGKHNLENIMSAYLASFFAGCDYLCLKKAVKSFNGIPHRLEFVKSINGIDYYNDSKSTNPDSTIVALNSFENKKIYLILGGSFKKMNYKKLSLKIKSKKVIPIIQGETADLIKENLKKQNIKKILEAKNLKEAFLISIKNAKSGDIVLLSPACPSFDQFDNFEKRGDKFKEYIYDFKKK